MRHLKAQYQREIRKAKTKSLKTFCTEELNAGPFRAIKKVRGQTSLCELRTTNGLQTNYEPEILATLAEKFFPKDSLSRIWMPARRGKEDPRSSFVLWSGDRGISPTPGETRAPPTILFCSFFVSSSGGSCPNLCTQFLCSNTWCAKCFCVVWFVFLACVLCCLVFF